MFELETDAISQSAEVPEPEVGPSEVGEAGTTRPRFVERTEQDLENLRQNKDSKRTKKVTEVSVKALKEFVEHKGKEEGWLQTCDVSDLATMLKEFYASVQRKDGEPYKKNSFLSMRYGLIRHFKLTRSIDITNEQEFVSANEMFDCRLAELKRLGKGSTSHYPEIEENDLIKLYAFFDLENPKDLQKKVQFDVMFYLCRRGRENLREMKKTHFAAKRDSSGELFVFQAQDEEDKNHRSDSSGDTPNTEGRIYEWPGLCKMYN